MRLFIAVNLPESVCVDLHEATGALRAAAPTARWVHPDMLHVTLKYLGYVTDEHIIVQIREHLLLAARSALPFDLQIQGLGAFPSLDRPRTLWAGVVKTAPLEWLQAAVEREIAPLGFKTDARPFHPHITLGRVRVALPSEEIRAAEHEAAQWTYQARAAIRTVELMESTPSPKGARYAPVKSCILGNTGDRPA